jgi:geranylgeranyl pyrophosphate synthase
LLVRLGMVAALAQFDDFVSDCDALLFADERRLNLEARRFLAALERHPILGAPTAAELRRALTPILNLSGRRVRPLLPFWLWRARGADPLLEPAIARVALATLLMHSAAIVIDDVEDGSRERGGHQALHHRQGEARALNAASLLVFVALQDLGAPRLVELAIEAVVRCHAGQALDLETSHPATALPLFDAAPAERAARYRACAEQKTAALMRFSLDGAAHILGEPAARLAAAIGGYGVGYQMLDDAKNFRPDLVGEKAFEDLRHGLKNWVCLKLIAAWSPAARDAARDAYGTPAIETRFLGDARLSAAWTEAVGEGAQLIDDAVRELARFGAPDYLRALVERPLDDLRRGLAHG